MRVILAEGVPSVVIAWLQALYSRSSETVLEHLDLLGCKIYEIEHDSGDVYCCYVTAGGNIDTEKATRFLEKWAIGYNHESILDTGTMHFFMEEIDLVTAKALEHHELYSGIELSTRYVDMDSDSEHYNEITEYLKHVASNRFPNSPEKARNAWVYDIAGAYLPLKTKTQMSLSVRVRTLLEILDWLDDVKGVPGPHLVREGMLAVLKTVYPLVSWEKGRHQILQEYRPIYDSLLQNMVTNDTSKDPYRHIIGKIDWRCWRDLSRHRRFYKMPFTYPAEGSHFQEWYIKRNGLQIDPGFAPENWEDRLMGHMVPFEGYIWNEQWEYLYKLRSHPAVHPILRTWVTGDEKYLNSIPYDPRAEQDIVKNEV